MNQSIYLERKVYMLPLFVAVAMLLSACQFALLSDKQMSYPLLATLSNFEQESPEQFQFAAGWDYIAAPTGIRAAIIEEHELWAITERRLLRWSREHGTLEEYNVEDMPLPNSELYDLVSVNDSLLIGGDAGIAIYDQNAAWTFIPAEATGIDFAKGVRLRLYDDALWALGDTSIARLPSGGSWEQIPMAKDADGTVLRRYTAQMRDGKLILAVGVGFTPADEWQYVEWSGKEWVTSEQPNLQYLQGMQGRLWKSNRGQLLYSEDEGQTWTEGYQRPDDGWISPKATDEKGMLLATTNASILMIQNDELVESYHLTDYSPEINYINILEFDEQGRLWIATDGRGLTMYDGELWHNWQPETSNMRDDAIRGMKIANGKVYAGTHGSAGGGGLNIFEIQTQTWTNYWPRESELSGGGVAAIAVTDDGRVYLPTAEYILDVLHPDGSWEHIEMPSIPQTIPTMDEGLVASDGTYWNAIQIGQLGLWAYDGEQWSGYGVPGTPIGLAEDSLGRLWVVGTAGLMVRDENKLWHYFSSAELPFGDEWVTDIAVDAQNRVWLLTHANIIVFNGDEFITILPQVVGQSNWDDAITISPQGQVWVSTFDGLAIFSGEIVLAPGGPIRLQPNASAYESDIRHMVE